MQSATSSLKNGEHSLDIIEAGITPVEADPNTPHVGIGGAPNILGELETDAAIMDGDNLNVGVVGALKGYVNTIWLARQVLDFLPHTMIVGEGASLFAKERGAKKITDLPEKVINEHQEWLRKNIPPETLLNWPNTALAQHTWPKPDLKSEKDTAIYLTRTTKGNIAGGTSTSGWDYKYPGLSLIHI